MNKFDFMYRLGVDIHTPWQFHPSFVGKWVAISTTNDTTDTVETWYLLDGGGWLVLPKR